MKRYHKIGLTIASLIALVSLVLAVPALAVESREGAPVNSDQPFLNLSEDDDDAASIKFGQNLLYAGNNVVNSALTDGLLFSFGNRMEMRGTGEYSIAAANILEIGGVTKKDLFAAGNLVHLTKDAEVGRDVYLAGNDIKIENDLSGNVAITANKVTFSDTTIGGDVNLSASQIIFGQNVSIHGTLVYNENAQVSGLDSASVAHVQTYVDKNAELSAGEIWTSWVIEVVGTFVAALVIVVVFPRLKDRIAAESNVQRFGTDFLNGLGFLVLVPILSILLMVSIFGMKAGLLLLMTWFLIVCLTGVFTGMWIGHLLIEKLFRSNNAPLVMESAIGIMIMGCIALVPGLNTLASFFSVIFGTGLMISCVRPSKTKGTKSVDESNNSLENPFRDQSKKTTVKPDTRKSAIKPATTKNRKSSSTKPTSSAHKPSRKK